MKENFLIDNLIKIGLIESEAKIYLNLLRKKSFTASEVSRLSGISRSKTYEILNQLIQKGLCVEILGSVKKYSPTNPETAFNGLKQNYQQELENKEVLISNLSETLLPLYLSEKGNTDPMDYIQVIREKNRILEKLYSLERSAKKEVLLLTKAPYVTNINEPLSVNREEYNCLKRGIRFKSVYEIDDARSLNFLKMIEMFASAGEEVRIVSELPMKVVIFDERAIMFTFKNIITSRQIFTAMVIEHPDLAKTQKEIFNMYWKKGMTLKEFQNKG